MLNIEVRYKGAYPLRRRTWNAEVAQPTLRDAGEFWHSSYRPKHFTVEGGREYGYYARKGELLPRGSKAFKRSYVGRKLAAKGHIRPLVWSGEGERLSRVRDVRANSKQVRVILPRKFNFRHPKSRIRMRDELTHISAREESAIADRADRQVGMHLARIRDSETKRLA